MSEKESVVKRGRPRKGQEPIGTRFAFRFSPEESARIDQLARAIQSECGRPTGRTDALRQAVFEALARRGLTQETSE